MPGKRASDPQAKLARVMEYQRALASFSRIASENLPPERLMQHACAQVSRVTHIRHSKVMRYRPDHGDLLMVAGVGWKPGLVGVATFSIDSASPPGRSIQTATPVMVEDLPNDGEFRMSPVLREHGIVSALNVPVMIDGETWGVLEVDAEEPRAFDDGDVGFMTTYANMIGMALARHEAQQGRIRVAQQHTEAEAVWRTLVQELQHRTKNNFQTIMSFIALQRRTARTQESRDRIASVMDRVHAIALAHDQLSMTEGTSQVEFCDYLRSLCAKIDPRRESVAIEVEADPAIMPLDRAVPAGLIVNELVTNAVKYAFDEAESGLIRVAFGMDDDTGEACVTVEDNGKGMGPPREGGLGLTLVDAFAQQLAGRVERDPVEKGTCTRVCFPLAI
ncbi:sensor histidine kinase [Microvirga massiliensis]|uniref:sensor histidine kinase n=1 Tax=Microvirga massiliensis TaxID=1033741 RepID=UPI00062BBFB0|nr:histidine kinase dimerization/phosphoacceptor domain -containing protein [Microvirga massiliensis]